MASIAILAFGSLIENPGKELPRHIVGRVYEIRTPFKIEFARSSSSRDGAPTLVPVDEGGDYVNAVLLELSPKVELANAKTLLWRREARQKSSEVQYKHPAKPVGNKVVIECLEGWHGFDVVLYAKIGANIRSEMRTPDHLADLAICSARRKAGAEELDGISYLASVLRQEITTPLTPDYKEAILRKTGANDLIRAREKILKGLA